MNVNINKNHLLHEVYSLQCRVNNLSIQKMEDVICMLQSNIFGLALIDMGNLVEGNIRSPMDQQVGTDGRQSEGLQVFGVV